MMYGNHMGAGGWIVSIFVTLLIVGLVVYVITALINGQRGPSRPTSNVSGAGEDAREVLDRRLASGEIGEEQYRRIRETLSERPVAAGTVDAASKSHSGA